MFTNIGREFYKHFLIASNLNHRILSFHRQGPYKKMVYVKKSIFSETSANSKNLNPKKSIQKPTLRGRKTQDEKTLDSKSKQLANKALSVLNKLNAQQKDGAQKLIKQTKITSFISNLEKENIRVERTSRNNVLDTKSENNKESSIPVWKRLQATEENRETQIIDVYDMSEDEQMQHEDKHKKKKAKRPKANARKNIQSKKTKKVLHLKSTECDGNQRVCDSKCIDENIPLPVMDQDESPEVAPSAVVINSTECPPMELTAPSLPPESERNNHHLTSVNEMSFEHDKTTILAELAEEIERSFLMPLMTSTPTERNRKERNKLQKIQDLSLMQVTFEVPREASPAERIEDSRDKEIQLFESPRKKKKSKQAPIMFPEKGSEKSFHDPRPLVSNAELETSVQLPNRSYHSCDNFKVHLVRTKRSAAVGQNYSAKKTKEQLLIEQMNKHFDEIDETDLCIE